MAAHAVRPEITPTSPRAQPSISVVIIAGSDLAHAQQAIAQAAPVCERMDVELLAVWSGPPAAIAPLRVLAPCVSWLVAPAGTSADELRRIGLRTATGDVVRLLDRGAVLDERWLSSVAPAPGGAPAGAG